MRAGVRPGEAGEQQGAGGDRRHGPGEKAPETIGAVPGQFHAAGDLADSRLDPVAPFGDDCSTWSSLAAVTAFEAAYGVQFPKATAKITGDRDRLLAFYDYPAEHWVHLRTTNPIESTFATVRHRTKITKGPGSRAAGLAMAFRLIESAQDRWHAVNAPHLVALVRAGAVFVNGKLVERPGEDAPPQAA